MKSVLPGFLVLSLGLNAVLALFVSGTGCCMQGRVTTARAQAPLTAETAGLRPVAELMGLRDCADREIGDLATDMRLRMGNSRRKVPAALSEAAVQRMRSMLNADERRQFDANLQFLRQLEPCDVYAFPRDDR